MKDKKQCSHTRSLSFITTMITIKFCLLLFFVNGCDGLRSDNETAVKVVIDRLLDSRKYDSTIQPSTEEATNVSIDITLINIGPVNDIDMKFGASFYLRQEWLDKRLRFDDLNRSILLSYKRLRDVWVPDLFFPKSKEEVGFHITTPNILLRIYPDGTVLYTQRIFVTFNCMMDLRKFPHDSQTCRIQMESYSFTTDDLNFVWSSARKATCLLPDANMPDFNVVNISSHDCTATYATGTFPCLYAELVMKRQVGFYLTQTYIPSILIVSLSWISFWIDHQAIPARISVGLLTVLTITTQSSGAMTQLPRVPYIKSIDVWMSTCLVFVFAAYMEYAFVTVLSRRHRKAFTRNPQTIRDKPSSESISCIEINGKHDAETGLRRRTFFRRPKQEQTDYSEKPPRDVGAQIDKISRFAFPIAFILFNLFYWVFYTVIL